MMSQWTQLKILKLEIYFLPFQPIQAQVSLSKQCDMARLQGV